MKFLSALLAIGCLSAATVLGKPLSEIPFQNMQGEETSLKAYQGKVVLIVNVASRCGLTKQYPALEALQKKYGPQGFTILAFPCNDFGGQEPGTNEEITEFCKKYDVSFPLMAKLHVKGPEQAPLYAALTGPEAKFPGDVKWNFGKFLISRDGEVLARFEPRTTPDNPEVTSAIESALATK